MKILLIHNSYQRAGGEDSVFKNEAEILRLNGVSVVTHEISNNGISGFWGRLNAALGVIFSVKSFFETVSLIKLNRPDVVHVHNFFPLVSPSVFYACQYCHVPVVHTLHNFRILCPTATLMHNGSVSFRSLSSGPWWALRHRVYRDSFFATFFLCLMIWVHKKIGTWRNVVSAYIVLSEFGLNIFSGAGIPGSKLFKKHNSMVFNPAASDFSRSGFIYVGRLSEEKGVSLLCEAAKSLLARESIDVRIVGSGPLDLSQFSNEIGLLGRLDALSISEQMQSSVALIIPSICLEGFPMVLVEAYANSLPVIASRLGALSELVEEGVTGLLFEPGDAVDLSEKLSWANSHPEKMLAMGKKARAVYEEKYTSQLNFCALMNIYDGLIGSSND